MRILKIICQRITPFSVNGKERRREEKHKEVYLREAVTISYSVLRVETKEVGPSIYKFQVIYFLQRVCRI